MCKANGLEFASLNTEKEFELVNDVLRRNSSIVDNQILAIGGISGKEKSCYDWYWLENESKVQYEMQWAEGNPDLDDNDKLCLALGPPDVYQFQDVSCSKKSLEFLCEKIIEI
jgi:hypothetical protein